MPYSCALLATEPATDSALALSATESGRGGFASASVRVGGLDSLLLLRGRGLDRVLLGRLDRRRLVRCRRLRVRRFRLLGRRGFLRRGRFFLRDGLRLRRGFRLGGDRRLRRVCGGCLGLRRRRRRSRRLHHRGELGVDSRGLYYRAILDSLARSSNARVFTSRPAIDAVVSMSRSRTRRKPPRDGSEPARRCAICRADRVNPN